MSQENVKLVREALEAFLAGTREDSTAGRSRGRVPRLIDAGDDVVVLLHEYRRGRGSGVELATKTAVVVAVSGGRAVRIQAYLDRAAALEACGCRSSVWAEREQALALLRRHLSVPQ